MLTLDMWPLADPHAVVLFGSGAHNMRYGTVAEYERQLRAFAARLRAAPTAARLFWLVGPRATPLRRTLSLTLLTLTLTLLTLTLTLIRWAPRLTSTTMSSAARDHAPRTSEAALTPTLTLTL